MKGKYAKRTAGSNAATKSSIKADDLMEKIKSAIKEVMSESEGKGGDPAEEGGADIAEIVTAIVDDIAEKRKSRKEAGEDVTELTEEDAAEIADAVEAMLGNILPGDEGSKAEEDEDGESKGDDPDDEEKGEEEQEDAKKKSRSASRQTKQRTSRPTVQRKYSSIYMQGGQSVTGSEKKQIPPMVSFARAVKCLDVYGHHDPERAAFYAKKYYDDENMSRQFKALSVTNPSAGGFLVPEVYLDQIIELLYPQTVIFELGAQKIPMPTGNVTIPKMTGGSRARWGGEFRKISKTQPKYGNLKLSSKRMDMIIPQSRELIMSTAVSADQLFANDLTTQMRLGLDYGALFGKGTEMEPLGVVNNKNIEHFSLEESEIQADNIVAIRAKVLFKNVGTNTLGWTFNSLVEAVIMNLKTSTGAYLYRDEMLTGKLMGAPYKVSNQVDVAKKGGKFLTSMIFGNWSELLVGEQLGLETYTSFDGTYTDDDGTVHSALEENLAVTRALTYCDIGTRHDESFLVIDNIDVTPMLLAKVVAGGEA